MDGVRWIIFVDLHLSGCWAVCVQFDILPNYIGCRYVYGANAVKDGE